MIRLPRLEANVAIVGADGKPSLAFQRFWQSVAEAIEAQEAKQDASIEQIQMILGLTDDLDAAVQAAQTAATNAQAAADDAAAAGAVNAREQNLVTSGVDPASVLTADSTTIYVAAHDRVYGDGARVAVVGTTLAATAPGDIDYVFYDDPDRLGGAVSYSVSTAAPVQTGDTHVVGAVEIPATGTVDGGEGPRFPGQVIP